MRTKGPDPPKITTDTDTDDRVKTLPQTVAAGRQRTISCLISHRDVADVFVHQLVQAVVISSALKSNGDRGGTT